MKSDIFLLLQKKFFSDCFFSSVFCLFAYDQVKAELDEEGSYTV